MAKEATQAANEATGPESAGAANAETAVEFAGTPQSGAETVVRVVGDGMDRLLERLCKRAASRSDGALTVDDIRLEIDAFKAEPNDEEAKFLQDAWQACLQGAEAARRESARTEPLERLVLNRFAHLLPAAGQAPVQGKHLSRRVVDPFIHVLRQLLGPESYERYRIGCRRMVQRLQKTHGPLFTWDRVAEEPIGQTVVNDILIYICRHFTDVGKRRRWMVDLIHSAMPADKEGMERNWQFGDREFHMLMDALYFRLRAALDNEDGRQSLVKRYNSTNVALLGSTLHALDRDYKAVMRNADTNPAAS